MSKYDPRNRDPLQMRPLKAEEIREERFIESAPQGGCGNRNCEMCYPNGRPDYTGAGKGDKPMSSREAEYRDIQKAMTNMMALRPDLMFARTPEPPSNAALNEAREAVEEWIIEIDPSTQWSDVIGNEAARSALIEAIETPIKHKALYDFYSMQVPKGLLLWGPPGNGKTMFARAAGAAIARLHSAGAKEILLVNGATLQSMWAGETEERIQSMFTYAREFKKAYGYPLLIFIDEADAILPPRSEAPMFAVKNVSTFLAAMDGVVESSAFVILATNRPESIDEALLRDGRCDRKIKVERPGHMAGREILQNAIMKYPHDIEHHHGVGTLAQVIIDYFLDPSHHVTNILISDEVHPMTLGHLISGAMLVGVVNRAKSIAFQRDLAAGTQTGIREADLRAAVLQTLADNIGLRHEYAALEMVERLGQRQRQSMN